MKTFFTLSIIFIILGFSSIPTIHQWERANNFPYGKICYSAFTFYVDTCKPVSPSSSASR